MYIFLFTTRMATSYPASFSVGLCSTNPDNVLRDGVGFKSIPNANPPAYVTQRGRRMSSTHLYRYCVINYIRVPSRIYTENLTVETSKVCRHQAIQEQYRFPAAQTPLIRLSLPKLKQSSNLSDKPQHRKPSSQPKNVHPRYKSQN